MSEENEIVPISEDALSVLDDTTGSSTSQLDELSVFRQGKESYFNHDDKKVNDIVGIFLMSSRPNRAFWPIDSEMDGSSPVCVSFDGVGPDERCSSEPQAGECAACPWNELGTAKVGRGKACKTKASDFVILPGPVEKSEEEKVMFVDKVYVNPQHFSPGLISYSIANAVSPKAFRSFVKSCKEIGRPPQGVLARWTWEDAKSKSNVSYSACTIDIIGVLPDHKEDPELWTLIINQVKGLKDGGANDVLGMLSGKVDKDSDD